MFIQSEAYQLSNQLLHKNYDHYQGEPIRGPGPG